MKVNHDAVSALPLAFSYYALVGPFTTHQRIFLFVGFLLGQTASDTIKRLTNHVPWIRNLTRRPVQGATCDLLSQRSYTDDAPGFPSGHMTVTTFFILALIRSEMRQKGISFQTYARQYRWQLTVHILVWLAMALARTEKGCHTWVQVFGGTLLGTAVYFTLESVAYSRKWL